MTEVNLPGSPHEDTAREPPREARVSAEEPGHFARSLWIEPREAIGWLRRRLSGPRGRALLLVVLSSLGIQLVLAPLTSWSTDTPAFINSVVALLYNGNPYATNQLFNPPLAAFLQAPFFAMLSFFTPPQNFVEIIPSILPATTVSGVSDVIPTWGASLALKVPLIAASIVSGFCLLYLGELVSGRVRSAAFASAWFLNPLVIWATAVHGEVDILAVAGVLIFLVAIQKRWYLLAGLAIGLSIMAKAYPLVLLPMSCVALEIGWRRASLRSYASRLTGFVIGVGLAFLPFLAFIPQLYSFYTSLYPSAPVFGGFSILILFNPGIFEYGHRLYPAFFSEQTGVSLHSVFAAFLVGTMALSLLLAYLASRTSDRLDSKRALQLLICATIAPLAGILLYEPSPQSENLLLVLPLLLLLTPMSRIFASILYWVLTAAGVMLYWALATPLGYFYPLANLLGPGSISYVNSVVIGYVTNPTVPPHDLWALAGLIGGTALILSVVLPMREAARQFRRTVMSQPTEER